MGMHGLAALLLAGAVSMPVAEIAQLLARRHIDPPAADALSGLSADELRLFLTRHDPHARYLAPADYQRFLTGGHRSVGVGAHLYQRGGAWYLQSVPDGPAWQSGLQGDVRLFSVDGVGVDGHDRDRLVQMFRGQADSEVLVVVQPPYADRTAFKIRRQAFQSPGLSYLQQDGLAFVRIWEFRRRETVSGLRRALARLPEDSGPLIIDLRQAEGGDLFEALDAASLFLPEGLSLAAIESNDGSRRAFRSTAERAGGRVLLLLGPGTASAAESFALALRHHGAALLVGERSYGKCLTQTVAPLSDGGAIRFSNGRLWGPDGVPCDPGGLIPDVMTPDVDALTVKALASAGLRRLIEDVPQ